VKIRYCENTPHTINAGDHSAMVKTLHVCAMQLAMTPDPTIPNSWDEKTAP